ncbi:MAG: cation-transporting P-type ATPase [Allomuricauda sp.]
MDKKPIDAYALPVERVAKVLDSNIDKGLGTRDVKSRLIHYGENCLPVHSRKGKLKILTEQFANPILYILSIAALLTFLFGEWLEALTVCIVIAITILVGFFMELSATRSLEMLRTIGQMECRVVRLGKIQKIATTQIVPGDILIFGIGDVIAADARLISTENLEMKESILTGESTPVEKDIKTLGPNIPMTDQKNMVFKGTAVNRGSAKAIVVATGPETMLGKIQALGESAKETRPPLDKKLNQLGRRLIWIMLAFVLPITLLGILRGKDILFMVETGVALAVATIPEGLPVVVTIALARGMLRLSKKQVVIKKMDAVEILGSLTMVATDKTGTLTEDNMTVNTISFEGGTFQQLDRNAMPLKGTADKKALEQFVLTSVLCNDMIWGADQTYCDSIDSGLLRFIERLGEDPKDIKERFPELYKLPFNEDLKLMATVNQMDNRSHAVFVKGAFESIAPLCTKKLYQGNIVEFDNPHEWGQTVEQMSGQGLRTIAMAYRQEAGTGFKKDDLLKNLVLIGIIGFIDPAREDVKDIMAIYKKAGVKVVMMTGDHPKTAHKIAEDIGLLDLGESNGALMEGKELDALDMDMAEDKIRLMDTKVFARVTPKQKLGLITSLQEQNNVIGMFGDGVNDVPALIKADIGIAMGKRGTEAAREAADIILKDDRFGAVELAIRQGRVIYGQIRQFLVYLLSCNLAEIIIVGIAALLNLPSPLLPLQILFLNLVTDIFPALALGFSKGEEGVMLKPPRKTEEPILTALHWRSIFLYSVSITCSVLGVTLFANDQLNLDPPQINNLAFYTLIIAQLLNVFNLPKRQTSFLNNEVTRNPWIWGSIFLCACITAMTYVIPAVAKALSLTPLYWGELKWAFIFGFSSLLLTQVFKRTGLTH